MSMSTPSARRKTTLSTSLSSKRRNRQRCRRPRRMPRMHRRRPYRRRRRQPIRPRPRSRPMNLRHRGNPVRSCRRRRRRSAQHAKIEIKPEAPPPASETPKPERSSREIPAPAAETPQKTTLAASGPPAETRAGDSAAIVEARRSSDGLSLTFSFATATPAALFRRADTVWLVFDSTKPIDIEPIRSKGGSIVADVSLLPLEKGQAIRIRLNRPQLPSLTGDEQAAGGANWTVTFADVDANANATAGGDPQHRRSRACQCHRAAVQTRPSASARRSGCRRHDHGGHGAAAGSRLHQAAGFCRGVAARIDPRRRDSSELR